jgi:hypothetical protein
MLDVIGIACPVPSVTFSIEAMTKHTKRSQFSQVQTLDNASLAQVVGGSGKRVYKPIRFDVRHEVGVTEPASVVGVNQNFSGD